MRYTTHLRDAYWSIKLLRRVPLAAGLVLSLHAFDTVNAAERNQQRLTELAAKLDATLQEIISDPGANLVQDDSLQRKKHNAAVVDLKRLSEFVTKLSAALTQGQNVGQTRPLYQKIGSLRQSVRDYAQGSIASDSVRDKADTARALLHELDTFYHSP